MPGVWYRDDLGAGSLWASVFLLPSTEIATAHLVHTISSQSMCVNT